MRWRFRHFVFYVFICYIGYLYGIRVGILTAFSYIYWVIQPARISDSVQTCWLLLCIYRTRYAVFGTAKTPRPSFLAACLVHGLHTIGGYLYGWTICRKHFESLAVVCRFNMASGYI